MSGRFTNIGGQPRNHIARLDGESGLADSFDPNANVGVSSIAVQPDGKIVVGGSFTTVSEQTRNRIARLASPQLQITSVTPLTNGYIVLQCLGVPNQVNNLQTSSDLSDGSFAMVSPAPPMAGATGAFEYVDDSNVGLTKRFYRIVFPQTSPIIQRGVAGRR